MIETVVDVTKLNMSYSYQSAMYESVTDHGIQHAIDLKSLHLQYLSKLQYVSNLDKSIEYILAYR